MDNQSRLFEFSSEFLLDSRVAFYHQLTFGLFLLTIGQVLDSEQLFNNFLILNSQTISYMAERVVGTGSFGVVFQVCETCWHGFVDPD